MSSPLDLTKFIKSKKYFGVPPFVIISGVAFTAFGAALNKLSRPKYFNKAMAPPDPVAIKISLRV